MKQTPQIYVSYSSACSSYIKFVLSIVCILYLYSNQRNDGVFEMIDK